MSARPVNQVLRTDGRVEQLQAAPSIAKCKQLIGATTLDGFSLRDGRYMVVDDIGHAAGKPRNEAATALYLSICRPGTSHFIAGDAVVIDEGAWG